MRLHAETTIFGTTHTVGDFWQWAYSDILSNRNRAIFAEFLVGTALTALDDFRIEWDSVDLHYQGKRIEVKSAAYIQSWTQAKPSRIVFNVSEKLSWDAATNLYALQRQRAADCYIFCLFTEIDKTLARESILNVEHWQFYVLATETINREFAKTKHLSHKRLCSICEPTDYASLRRRVDQILLEIGNSQ
jgi:hypothetical protein